MTPPAVYKPSRFTLTAWEPSEPRSLLAYNSFTGGFARFVSPTAERVASLMTEPVVPEDAHDLLGSLASAGLVVDERIDELALASATQEIYKGRRDSLNLILMPTEKCMFRCVYCYEDFLKGKMSNDVKQGVMSLVENQAHGLRRLKIDWFGGEPLSAFSVVKELSEGLLDLCDRFDVEYASSMTTNAYLLDEVRAPQALALQIRRFQITLDGPAETHDSLRVLQTARARSTGSSTTCCSCRVSMKTIEFGSVSTSPQKSRRLSPNFCATSGNASGVTRDSLCGSIRSVAGAGLTTRTSKFVMNVRRRTRARVHGPRG